MKQSKAEQIQSPAPIAYFDTQKSPATRGNFALPIRRNLSQKREREISVTVD